MPDEDCAGDKADLNPLDVRKKSLVLPRVELPSPARPSRRLVVKMNELSRLLKFIKHLLQ